ncbi:6-hydroxymethylpterin diphosphokinase MptE-like protein [Paraglaciecola sp. 2405UD69-4]|uniref:6-hydroxymethylpterin diphosphokinase MptE-like protein n=1 Tax=Paraglaciecola sp. 2405UD69-4 TaxID=3391836 RepID=UPI0039C9CEE6
MLKNIRLHIEKDEQKQALLEDKLAKHVLKTQKENINAFQRNIPSLLNYIESTDLANFSLFINKYGEHNIVDYGQGRSIYGFHPEEEILAQLKQKQKHSPEVNLNNDKQICSNELEEENLADIQTLQSFQLQQQLQILPQKIECLVVLGCGLGLHLEPLLEQHDIKNLVIYEPELQFFKCSVMDVSWARIFSLIQQKDTSIFLQLGKDGRDLIADIRELKDHCGVSSFHLYKHYNHQVFDSIEQDILTRSWSDIQESGFSIQTKDSYLDYVPNWTPKVDLETHKTINANNNKLSNNLAAFKKYFPDIYEEFKDYKPQKWLPIESPNGEINLLHIKELHTWYGTSPKQECILNFENFDEQPNKDGLVLGYKGTKLAHYVHYQFVKETEELLQKAEEEIGALPDTVQSLIMFGIGTGYQLEKLLEEHTVEKLFVCEPNPDFFCGSLFAIDWHAIFETVEKSGARIYLNIGDDGTNLFRDLLNQFYAIGPYILNSTYFYQSYHNASLNKAISQLREQLQVVISMGEYFDHAYYGIAHTAEGMKRKIPALVANPSEKLSYDDKEVPIFIVGNGPSLDSSIDAIKEWQGQAIVISCGTALQALHRHGITPNFHAEIEQNRCTFDWAALIGDLEYLKHITLISCNGIHPDTCDLYKDVMVAFKEGESSTVSALNVLGRENYQVLQNAFPTVSNFVCDLFSTMGFTNIYLIGVDLGFINVKHHHSKSSGYYQEDGEETYDYSEKNNTSIVVPGNFRPTVNTKHEFKVSRQVIEQVTAKKPKGQSFYNCSDGAKILGTLPLRPDDLLIVATNEQKKQLLNKLSTEVFSSNGFDNYEQRFNEHFSKELLIKEIGEFEQLLEKDITSVDDVQFIITKQKEMLFSSYKTGKSLLFYYLYGTVNYANAVAEKLRANLTLSRSSNLAWRKYLKKIKLMMAIKSSEFDLSSYRESMRAELLLSNFISTKSILIITNSTAFINSIKWAVESMFRSFAEVIAVSPKYIDINKTFDFVIYYVNNHLEERENSPFVASKLPINGKLKTLWVIDSSAVRPTTFAEAIPSLSIVIRPPMLSVKSKKIHNIFVYAINAIRACVDSPMPGVIVPRLKYTDTSQIKPYDFAKVGISTKCFAVRFKYYSVIPFEYLKHVTLTNSSGNVGFISEQLDDDSIYMFQKSNDDEIENNVLNYQRINKHLFIDKKFDSLVKLSN